MFNLNQVKAWWIIQRFLSRMVCNENMLHYILMQDLIGPLLVEQPTLGIDDFFHKCELSF